MFPSRACSSESCALRALLAPPSAASSSKRKIRNGRCAAATQHRPNTCVGHSSASISLPSSTSTQPQPPKPSQPIHSASPLPPRLSSARLDLNPAWLCSRIERAERQQTPPRPTTGGTALAATQHSTRMGIWSRTYVCCAVPLCECTLSLARSVAQHGPSAGAPGSTPAAVAALAETRSTPPRARIHPS